MTDNRQHTSAASWEEQLRSQLAHQEAEPPADLWADIEREIASPPVLSASPAALPQGEGARSADRDFGLVSERRARRREKGRVVPLYARWTAAAAVLLAVGIGLWTKQVNNEEGASQDGSLSGASPSALEASPPALPQGEGARSADRDFGLLAENKDTKSREAASDKQEDHAASVHNTSKATSSTTANVNDYASEATSSTTANGDDYAAEATSTTTIGDESSSKATPHTFASLAETSSEATNSLPLGEGGGRGLRSLRTPSFSFFLSSSYHMEPTYEYASDLLPSDNGSGSSLSSNATTDSHKPRRPYGYTDSHRFPIKTAALVRWRFSNRLALDAGLSYTFLYSSYLFYQGIEPADHWPGHQRVHFLGLPVSLCYNLVEGQRWSIYVNAGGEVAKAVSVQWRGDKGQRAAATDHPWQTSISAALGFQYNLSPHVGLYLQPSADYYIPNGSSVHTYYNDYPFTPSLQMGLRFNIESGKRINP